MEHMKLHTNVSKNFFTLRVIGNRNKLPSLLIQWYSRPVWMLYCETYFKEPPLAGRFWWSTENPSNPYNSLIMCDSISFLAELKSSFSYISHSILQIPSNLDRNSLEKLNINEFGYSCHEIAKKKYANGP